MFDSMNNWQNKYNQDPFEAMASKDFEMQPVQKMMKELEKYVYGVNREFKEIKQYKPILVVHKPTDDIIETQTTCLWLGPEYANMKPPTPINNEIFIFEKPAHSAYAK